MLTLYHIWWRFTLVTVGRTSLPYLVLYKHHLTQLRCKLNIQKLTKEYTILWFDFDKCSFRNRIEMYKWATTMTTERNIFAWYVNSKLSTNWKTSYFLGCWLFMLSRDGFQLWLLGVLFYLSLFGIDTVKKSWGVNWIFRDLPRNTQFFDSSSICVVRKNDETGTREWQQWQHHTMVLFSRALVC